MVKYISILGSTGSIGTSALDVIANHPEHFQIIGLTANHNIELLEKQIEAFHPPGSYPNHFIHIIQINFLKGETHMISKLNPASIEIAKAILAIQIPAYEIEAKYINSHAIPRLYDRITDIQNCKETFYGYFLEHTLVGFISFTNEESFVDIHRLVVSPNYFHRGIATDLLLHLFQLFPHMHTYIVQTGKANTPALSLYKKHGFIETQNILLPDGTLLVKLEKSK